MRSTTLTKQQREELAALDAMFDADIDTTDTRKRRRKAGKRARRDGLYRPIKQPVTIRLDADGLAWFKDHAEASGYQTEINRVLRQQVIDAEKKRA